MSVEFKNNLFCLSTPNTSYVFELVEGRILLHCYYGKKIENTVGIAAELKSSATSATLADFEHWLSLDCVCQEFPTYGNTDLRTPAFHAQYENGSRITNFEYVSHRIYAGKPELNGLPATYTEDDGEADTLEIKLKDSLTGLTAYLSYTIFNNVDAIAKSVRFVNNGNQNMKLMSVYSTGFDFEGTDYDLIHLSGRWACERNIVRTPLTHGSICIDSKRTASGHMHNPFIAIASKNANEDTGDVYGFSLIYSGNFAAHTEVDHMNHTRVLMGINPFDFSWTLEPNKEFQTPEVVMVYSSEGIGAMSRTYHKLYRKRLCRGKYRDVRRPVLLNNWEATCFDFNEEKIVEMAKSAKKIGVEMLVLDDGWFGKRNSDKCSLGDWYANKEKLPNGIDGLAKKMNDIGMKFGLWFEPEMISPDSDLFRKHPDWCIHAEGRAKNESRNQLVLDLSREDVCDYIKGFLRKHLSESNIAYVKWDMNRNVTDLGSQTLSKNRQQEQAHRYILGLYDILETVTSEFPDVLFEGCSGGGGRFDPGMLYYSPQIWTSDCTDAIERLKIQHGTSIVYPFSTMGCHISAVPNQQCRRTTPFETRFNVAIPGAFGYELELDLITEEERKAAKEQIAEYIANADFLHDSDFYRLRSPFEGDLTAWEFSDEKRGKVMVMACVSTISMFRNSMLIKLKGLDKNAAYKCSDGKIYNGSVLMNFGYRIYFSKDFESCKYYFDKITD